MYISMELNMSFNDLSQIEMMFAYAWDSPMQKKNI